MNCPSYFRLPSGSLPKRFATCLALSWFAMAGLTTSTNVVAADCGCEQATCGCETAFCDCRPARLADCCCSSRPKHVPIFKRLEAFAGSIEKTLGLDQCDQCNSCDDCAACSKPTGPAMPCFMNKPSCLTKMFSASKDLFAKEPDCDDACDAAMIQELMMPIPDSSHHHHHEHHQHNVHSGPVRLGPAFESPAGPQSWPMPSEMRMTEPRIEATPRRPQPTESGTVGPESSRTPIPEPMPLPAPPADAEPAPGPRLFDNLRDPFSDDEVRIGRPPYRSVRPSSYSEPISDCELKEDTVLKEDRPLKDDRQPVTTSRSRVTPSPSYRTSSRRSKSVR